MVKFFYVGVGAHWVKEMSVVAISIVLNYQIYFKARFLDTFFSGKSCENTNQNIQVSRRIGTNSGNDIF